MTSTGYSRLKVEVNGCFFTKRLFKVVLIIHVSITKKHKNTV